ncbi:MAG: 2-oxo acid dehydrogenase subunit E2 [Treponema sp.]|jgi:pyruvate dehydrogenase E2 component (dihydrolipoamide acetyltransferase)|nr:2-oxo acid dehydrogenase subunit E2 [Treponema sp.]
MAERIIMPKQGLQMTEGTIMEWLVPEGGEVVEGKPLFSMETDKLTITIDAMVSGTLLKIIAGPGVTVPITGLIAVVGKPGEDISGILAEAGTGQADAVSGPPPQTSGAALSSGGAAERTASTGAGLDAAGGRRLISPRAKLTAGERGVDWRVLRGSGPDGMIVERDIPDAASAGTASGGAAGIKATPLAAKTAALSGISLAEVPGTGIRGKVTRDDVERARQGRAAGRVGGIPGEKKIVPMKGMRKIIAERMKQSQNENAQTTHRVSVRMDEAVRLRAALEKAVGYNDFIAMAAVRALRDFPEMNAELGPDGIWRKEFVNLGVAVAVDDGLIVPVVKDADLLSLKELALAIKELADKARNGSLQPDDYSGGTFTLSNLGMFGLEEFTAIINPPEAGILAVGMITDTPVAVSGEGGAKTVEIHPVLKLTLSYDHRVVDGAPAARFLARIKEYLENPYKML